MTLRVLVLEDSPIVQQRLREVLGEAPEIVVTGMLTSSSDPAFEPLLQRADVVLLDLLLPSRSGLSLVGEIARRCPVVIVSDADERSPMVHEALDRGAQAHVTKRELATEAGAARLRDLVRHAGGTPPKSAERTFVVVGSTGALPAHDRVLRALRPWSPPLVLLQHMPPTGDSTLRDWVGRRGWCVEFAHDGSPVVPGRAWLAPSGQGHVVFRSPQHLAIRRAPAVDGHTPSASLLIQSGRRLGSRLVAVVLSGLGCDGSSGVAAVLDAGGEVLAVDPEECAAPSMPRAALEADSRVQKFSLDALAEQLAQRAGG